MNGIPEYFIPVTASTCTSGAGGILGGQAIGEDLTDPGEGPSRDPTEEDIEEARRAQEQERFEQAAEELEQLIKGIPELSELSDSLLINNTPEGLRIQIVDQDGLPMFPSGSAAMCGYTREIFGLVARVINKLSNDISISGHTDATPFIDSSGYSNWELSADRALATRRVLQDFGGSEQRVAKVTGQAANEPLLVDDPRAPQNRRISVVLLRSDDSVAERFNRLPDFLERATPQR